MATLPIIKWKTFIATPVERVFRTLTTAEGWDGWFTRGTTLDARPGGQLRLRWNDAERERHRATVWGPVHLDNGGVVVAVEPDRRFSFEWTTADHPTTIDFRLARRGSGTLVTLTESGYTEADLRPTGIAGQLDDHSPFAMCASGWGEALTLLKFYLEHGITYGPVPPE